MFGNGQLPNIVPPHSFHSPPPSTTHPLPLLPLCAPASAHLGQAGAAHCRAPRTHVTTDTCRHDMTHKHLHCCHQPPHHHRRQHPDAPSPPSMTAYAPSPLLTTDYTTSHPLTMPKRHVTDASNLRCHGTVNKWSPLPSLRDVGAKINE